MGYTQILLMLNLEPRFLLLVTVDDMEGSDPAFFGLSTWLLCSLGEIDNAHTIAKRALATISFCEEAEKLNVWVAYFNLENEYGNPLEEAVAKVFKEALQYCDQRKEIRLGDEEVIRALFERATSLSLSSKNMKSLFKKYLEYEKGHGDEDRVEYVKGKAIECVENSLA
ncbi:hypothetical protein IFM89_027922 [Coptis chinensis]|uniref:Uncharacterized protein n=1 Tax=Coptis chinensis TaxID=261450 RepID=A0A835HHZ2_9MAGN|nr:hypothetical protein IFM89_027922 [Coptis chinensis]